MKTEHQQHSLFQTIGNQVRLDVTHAVLVHQRRVMRGANTIPFHRIYAVSKGGPGCGFIRNPSSGTCFNLESGCIYFMPAMQPLAFAFCPGLCMSAFHFTFTLGTGIDLFHNQSAFMRQRDCAPLTEGVIRALVSPSAAGGMIRARGLLMEMASCFMSDTTVELRRLLALRAKYGGLFAYVDNACTAQLRVSQLAAVMHMTPSALSRNFHRDVGMTVKDYICRSLVQRASQALLLSDRSIKAIAYDLEFPNEFYFSRFFKRHTDTPPTRFRGIYG